MKYFPIFLRGRALTNINPLVTVGPRPSVSAAAAVIPAEVPITLTSTVEVTDGPSLPVVPSVVRVLRAVRARVHRDGHALSAPRAGPARVVVESEGRRAALSTPESFGCHTLSGELGAHHHRAHKHQETAPKHDPNFYARLELIWIQFYRVNIHLQIYTATKTLSEINFHTPGITFSVQ